MKQSGVIHAWYWMQRERKYMMYCVQSDVFIFDLYIAHINRCVCIRR
jgi:hypothetical protein